MDRSVVDIPRVVRTLLAHQTKQHAALAEHMHIGASLLSKKLGGLRGWSADDITAMAEFFDVPQQLFFDDPENLVRTSHGQHPPDDDGGGVAFPVTRKEHGGISRFPHLVAA